MFTVTTQPISMEWMTTDDSESLQSPSDFSETNVDSSQNETQADCSLKTVELQIKSYFMALRRGGACQSLCDKTSGNLRQLLSAIKTLTMAKVIDQSAKQCIEVVYAKVDNLVHCQSSQSKRRKQIEESRFYIKPVFKSCGHEGTKRKHETLSPLTNIELKFPFFPVTESLKVLFKSSAFRKAFNEKDHTCLEGLYKGPCCGQVAKNERWSKLCGVVHVKIQIYYDGFSPVDGLKCHASEYSTGAVYMRILNLPGKYQSSQMGIHLVALFFEKWFKKSTLRSMNSVFEPIINDIGLLEKGILIEYVDDDGTPQSFLLRGSIFNCIHDNLGCNKQFGLSGGFNTKYPCAICFEDTDTQQELFYESDKLRQPDFYHHLGETLYSDDLTATYGLRERTPFASLAYYNIGEAMTRDPLHDLEEGLEKDVLHAMFDSLLRAEKKQLTKEQIVARAQSFNYGILDSQYAPHTFTLDKNSFGLSAIHIRNFVMRFIFIFGNLENESNKKKFDVIRNLILIHKFAYSSQLCESDIAEMENVIKNFLEGVKNEFKLRITPKMHNLIHYPNVVRRLGPMHLMNTAACESKHHFFNLQAHSISNMSQLLQNFANRYIEAFVDSWEHTTDLSSTRYSAQNKKISNQEAYGFNETDEIFDLKFFYDQYEYRSGLFVLKKIEGNYQFYKIQKVLSVNQEIQFLCSTVETKYDEEHVSFKILNEDDNQLLLKISELHSAQTYDRVFSSKNLSQYILTKCFV